VVDVVDVVDVLAKFDWPVGSGSGWGSIDLPLH
jgi:hypothetical protein